MGEFCYINKGIELQMVYVVAIWNLVVFFMFGIDKFKAKNNMWRISEKTLLLSSVIMGGIGGFFGMCVFHHKTKHTLFRAVLPITFLITVLGLYAMIFILE